MTCFYTFTIYALDSDLYLSIRIHLFLYHGSGTTSLNNMRASPLKNYFYVQAQAGTFLPGPRWMWASPIQQSSTSISVLIKVGGLLYFNNLIFFTFFFIFLSSTLLSSLTCQFSTYSRLRSNHTVIKKLARKTYLLQDFRNKKASVSDLYLFYNRSRSSLKSEYGSGSRPF